MVSLGELQCNKCLFFYLSPFLPSKESKEKTQLDHIIIFLAMAFVFVFFYTE